MANASLFYSYKKFNDKDELHLVQKWFKTAALATAEASTDTTLFASAAAIEVPSYFVSGLIYDSDNSEWGAITIDQLSEADVGKELKKTVVQHVNAFDNALKFHWAGQKSAADTVPNGSGYKCRM